MTTKTRTLARLSVKADSVSILVRGQAVTVEWPMAGAVYTMTCSTFKAAADNIRAIQQTVAALHRMAHEYKIVQARTLDADPAAAHAEEAAVLAAFAGYERDALVSPARHRLLLLNPPED